MGSHLKLMQWIFPIHHAWVSRSRGRRCLKTAASGLLTCIAGSRTRRAPRRRVRTARTTWWATKLNSIRAEWKKLIGLNLNAVHSPMDDVLVHGARWRPHGDAAPCPPHSPPPPTLSWRGIRARINHRRRNVSLHACEAQETQRKIDQRTRNALDCCRRPGGMINKPLAVENAHFPTQRKISRH